MIKYKVLCLIASGILVLALGLVLWVLSCMKDGLPDIDDIKPRIDRREWWDK